MFQLKNLSQANYVMSSYVNKRNPSGPGYLIYRGKLQQSLDSIFTQEYWKCVCLLEGS